MHIYTSYFANVKNLPKNILPVSIANITPKGWEYPIYQGLAPSDTILKSWKQNQDNLDYIFDYEDEILNQLQLNNVMDDLLHFLKDDYTDIALICYEKPTDFCHRHLVADWFKQNHIPCKEWENNK